MILLFNWVMFKVPAMQWGQHHFDSQACNAWPWSWEPGTILKRTSLRSSRRSLTRHLENQIWLRWGNYQMDLVKVWGESSMISHFYLKFDSEYITHLAAFAQISPRKKHIALLAFQEVQPHMALRDRTQLWFLRDTRDQAFHLLLLGTGATNDFSCRRLLVSGFFRQILGLNTIWVDWGFIPFIWVFYISVPYVSGISSYLSFGLPSNKIKWRSPETNSAAAGKLIVSTWRHLLNYTKMKVDGATSKRWISKGTW